MMLGLNLNPDEIRTPAQAVQLALNYLLRTWPHLREDEKVKVLTAMHAFLREVEKEEYDD
jgi:hypothetical protein